MSNPKYFPPDDVNLPVRVNVCYSDGNYWLEKYTPEMEKLGMAYVEVSLIEWEQYLAYEATARSHGTSSSRPSRPRTKKKDLTGPSKTDRVPNTNKGV